VEYNDNNDTFIAIGGLASTYTTKVSEFDPSDYSCGVINNISVAGRYITAFDNRETKKNVVYSCSWDDSSHKEMYTFGLGFNSSSNDSSVYQIKGLQNDIVTWSGTAGTTVYCNSSGDTNEWLEVNMSINSTDNVTEIRVWVGDLNNSIDINASNITLWVANTSNTTYYSFGTFTDGGGNITINQSTWNSIIMIDNPFNGTGLTDTNTSIFLLFRLAIPAAAPTDIFWSASSTAWKIYLGYTV